MADRALDALDQLIGGWNYWDQYESMYLNELAPAIVARTARMNDREAELVAILSGLLTEGEWESLPELIRLRRAGELEDLDSDRERHRQAEADKRLREEAAAAQAAAELEREVFEERRRREAVERLNAVLDEDFLGARSWVLSSTAHDRSLGAEEFDSLATDFVREWARSEIEQRLDPEQASAVAHVDGHVQVVARAGSGKTLTLVSRALFLAMHCGVNPSAMLLLAFNRKAAKEMRSRLSVVLGEAVPHVMTFHALAYALANPEEDLVSDDRDADQLGQSWELQTVIDQFVRSDEHGGQVRELMMAYFREDWEKITKAGLDLSIDEFLAKRRALPGESLKGDFVKSFGEKLIANTLFENDIDYRYEQNHRRSGVNYRPDFTVNLGDDKGVVIEYFGLEGDPDYDEQMKAKRRYWEDREGWVLIERTPPDVARLDPDSFALELLGEMAELGVTCRRLGDDELWGRMKDRAIDRFTEAMNTTVGLCRRQNLSCMEFQDRIEGHLPATRHEQLYLELAALVYPAYLDHLSERGLEDFDGLMWRAIEAVRSGVSRFVRDGGRERGDLTRLRFVMIDEFQDFSEMFFNMVKAVLELAPTARVYAVGDDWQAINSFAGSELWYFENFAEFFERPERTAIRTNYRSDRAIVEAGNALMEGLGAPSLAAIQAAGQVRVGVLDDFQPTAAERDSHDGDEITPAVVRIVTQLLMNDLDVVLLARTNRVPWFVGRDRRGQWINRLPAFLEHIRSFLPEDDRHRVEISTSHKYKGLESPAVVVLDAVDARYPLIHPSWIFQRVFGVNPAKLEQEERRLFYVAVSRAEHSLTLLTERRCESPFLSEMRTRLGLEVVDWESLRPAPSLAGERLEIRVHNGFDVMDILARKGYAFDGARRCWAKVIVAELFDLELLVQQDWTKSGYLIEVMTETGEVLHRLNAEHQS